MIDALERDLGLSEAQVITRLANEERAAAAEASLTPHWVTRSAAPG
ncbi:hypothetical protein ACFQ0B_09770 [Nonomuraea thailandensis]